MRGHPPTSATMTTFLSAHLESCATATLTRSRARMDAVKRAFEYDGLGSASSPPPIPMARCSFLITRTRLQGPRCRGVDRPGPSACDWTALKIRTRRGVLLRIWSALSRAAKRMRGRGSTRNGCGWRGSSAEGAHYDGSETIHARDALNGPAKEAQDQRLQGKVRRVAAAEKSEK